VSPAKCSAADWLEVMHQAHILNLPTSATMMFGHVETIRERIEHLAALRETQSRKPDYSQGFVTFIPWPFCSDGTRLEKELGPFAPVDGDEYVRMIAISRLMLNNIRNIQASWLTVGKSIGQVCLHSGANDFGSIMMEEHVVSAAGANYSLDSNEMVVAIREAGFVPCRRNSRSREGVFLPKEGTGCYRRGQCPSRRAQGRRKTVRQPPDKFCHGEKVLRGNRP
jgi:cyclic dehypoxanthinyl futalosine synthase